MTAATVWRPRWPQAHRCIEAEVRPIAPATSRWLTRMDRTMLRAAGRRPLGADPGTQVLPGEHSRLHRAGRGFDSHRLHAVHASVVSTASTRLLYGRGAGSTPAGGSSQTPVAQRTRALPCEGRGRWFESSRAYSRGRSSSGKSTGAPLRRGPFEPGRPLSSLPEGPWCNGKHGELQPRWSGFDSWGACSFHRHTTRRGPERLGYLMDRGLLPEPRGSKPRPDRTPRPRRHSADGPEGSGYRLRIDRSRVRVPPGALAVLR